LGLELMGLLLFGGPAGRIRQAIDFSRACCNSLEI